ncbi:SLC13 family permease [Rhizobium sp. CSW-27]|uniref:SLC13 family permease n=1 Tax=Rhizobium sp. CSW-27 TaxID=2839985 RepID=UPI001C019131|nr:SLC13 family permease [Rhizobium sp. CSW-27]MBT9371338.1 anion permease [Rhizobium sp. CSW-27]
MLIIVLLLGLVLMFAMDRFRAESVAIGGLALATILGLVPLGQVFSGLTSPAAITVIEVLLIVQVLRRARLFGQMGGWLQARLHHPRRAVLGLCVLAALLSSVMNNVAAFSLMLPVCVSVMARNRIPARWMFLPLSYATLLGGAWTSIGTPPNLVAGALLTQATGRTYAFLDFAPVGLAASAAALAVMVFWLPRSLMTEDDLPQEDEESTLFRHVMTELLVWSDSSGQTTVAMIEEEMGGRIRNIVRDGRRVFPLKPETPVMLQDRLLVEAHPAKLDACLATGSFTYALARRGHHRRRAAAVVMPHSVMLGSCMATLDPEVAAGVTILGVEGEPARFEGPFEELPLRVGNRLRLEGESQALRAFIAYFDLVEVADEQEAASSPVGVISMIVFVFGVVAAALGLVAAELALGGVVVVFCLAGWLDLRLGLRNLNWSIIILLVAMLPLGSALGTTGAAAGIAHALVDWLPVQGGAAAVFLLLALAMLITPFVNNTTTLAILAPIALEVARAEGLSPQMLLMAVTVGASLDFLTPFGHHNNTLAYSLGSYRFRDFLRAGWPVSLAAGFAAGVALLLYW